MRAGEKRRRIGADFRSSSSVYCAPPLNRSPLYSPYIHHSPRFVLSLVARLSSNFGALARPSLSLTPLSSSRFLLPGHYPLALAISDLYNQSLRPSVGLGLGTALRGLTNLHPPHQIPRATTASRGDGEGDP